MQQRLDRRVGRAGIEQVQALHIDHRLVGQRVERAKFAQRLELHRRQTGWLDIGHVGARALDANDLVLKAEIVSPPRLHRRVAAAMQHEQRIAPQQPRGVDPKRDVFAYALLGVGLDRLARGFVVPLALHGPRCCKFPLRRQVPPHLPERVGALSDSRARGTRDAGVGASAESITPPASLVSPPSPSTCLREAEAASLRRRQGRDGASGSVSPQNLRES